jgi:hypothetical protein
MFCIEARAMYGYESTSPFGRTWEPVTFDATESMTDSLDDAIADIRVLWDFDRESGANDSMYRVRRLSDQYIVFTKGV